MTTPREDEPPRPLADENVAERPTQGETPIADELPDVDAPTAEAATRENSLAVVWALAWPVVALNALQVINTLIDRYFIGHLDVGSLTAHGGAASIMFLAFSLAVSVAAGPTAIVSRAFGADNHAEVREGARQSLAVSMYAGIATAILIALIAHPVAGIILPKDDPAAIRKMGDFIALYAIGLPAVFVIQTLAASLRGIGDTKSPTVISGIQIALHVAGNVFLIPRVGLNGAAIALSISAWIAAALYILFARTTPLAVPFSLLPPGREWFARLLRVAAPAAGTSTLRVLSLTTFTTILALVPNHGAAIAAMTTAFAIESILIAPAFGLAAAAGTLVGQSLGMGSPARAERLAWTCAGLGVVCVLVPIAPVAIFTPGFARTLVGDKPDVIFEAVRLMRIMCATEVFFSVAMVLFGAMQGAGDTVRPLWVSMLSLWGVRVPLAACLALGAGASLGAGITLPFGLGLGALGAWIAIAITQGMQGVLAAVVFRAGAWKTQRV